MSEKINSVDELWKGWQIKQNWRGNPDRVYRNSSNRRVGQSVLGILPANVCVNGEGLGSLKLLFNKSFYSVLASVGRVAGALPGLLHDYRLDRLAKLVSLTALSELNPGTTEHQVEFI
ncbi:hypothetical protein IIA29_01425 [candidate division KSB1 bacterium]|nr:hypothetical protein [candidate division KSB1 bacterium]